MPREHKDHKEHKRRHSSKSNSGESGSSHKRKHRHEVAESNDESIKPPKREKESRHHHQSQVEPDEKRQKHEHRKHHKSEKSRDVKPSALSSSVKLKPLDELDILGDLSDLNDESSTKVFANHSMASASSSVKYDPLLGLTSRKQRTAVFAGSHRAATVSQVFSLEEICLRVLMENIDKLTSVGDAPFYLMKPVLAKCNPIQLSRIEDFNPHLVEECDELWKEHCRGEFRGQQPDDEEDETWRDLYFRAKEERDNKLKMLTSTIKKTTEARAAPVRKTVQMDSFASGRMKNGRAQFKLATVSASSTSSAKVKDEIHRARMATQGPRKPNKAPLMVKSLQMLKTRFRR